VGERVVEGGNSMRVGCVVFSNVHHMSNSLVVAVVVVPHQPVSNPLQTCLYLP
jgi:hypothetical protein